MRGALWLGSLLSLVACSSKAPPPPPAALQVSAPVDAGPPPAAVQVPLPTGPIGTAHPLVFMRADPKARWVVTCQAREDTDGDGKIQVGVGQHGDLFGDAMRPYLVLGAGAGTQLDAFVAADRSGDHVAYVRDGKLYVHDVVRGTTLDLSALGADASDDPSPLGDHRALSFDHAGNHLLYLRGTGATSAAVVRDLGSGAESLLPVSAGLLWRAAFAPDGFTVVAQVVTHDTDGDGNVAFPVAQTSLSKRGCRGPIMSYSTSGLRGDQAEPQVANASGGAFRAVPGLVGSMGEALIVKESTGLVLLEGNARTSLGSGTCELLHADAARHRVLSRCDSELFWWSPNASHLIGFKGQNASLTRAASLDDSPRYVAIDAAPWSLLDLDTGALVDVGEVAQVLAGGAALLMHREKNGKVTHWWLDIAQGARKLVLANSDYVAPELRTGHLAALDGKLIDLTNGTRVGSYAVRPLALAEDGQVLYAPASAQRGRRTPFDGLPTGPLEWKASK